MPEWARDVAAHAVRRGLARARLAARARRPQRDADPADDLFRGDVAAARSCAARTRRASASSPRRSTTTARPSRRNGSSCPTLRAEISWCLGMSEPGAGSDLASLKTRAELDRRRVRRERPEGVDVGRAPRRLVPLLRAHRSRRVPKHKGISALIIDTTTPGVERRPFPELSDPDFCDFNEVFFTDVRVPEGEPHRPAQRRLADHAGIARARAGDVLDQLRVRRATRGARARRARRPAGARTAAGSATTPRYRDAVAGFYVDAQALLAMGYRGFSKFLTGKSSPEHSLLKLFGSESLQRALLFGTRGARHRRRSTSTGSARRCGATARGRSSTCARSAARSPAARARSSATSSPSACSGCPVRDARRDDARLSPWTSRPARSTPSTRARYVAEGFWDDQTASARCSPTGLRDAAAQPFTVRSDRHAVPRHARRRRRAGAARRGRAARRAAIGPATRSRSNSRTGSRPPRRSTRSRTSARSSCRSCTSTARRRSATSCARRGVKALVTADRFGAPGLPRQPRRRCAPTLTRPRVGRGRRRRRRARGNVRVRRPARRRLASTSPPRSTRARPRSSRTRRARPRDPEGRRALAPHDQRRDPPARRRCRPTAVLPDDDPPRSP